MSHCVIKCDVTDCDSKEVCDCERYSQPHAPHHAEHVVRAIAMLRDVSQSHPACGGMCDVASPSLHMYDASGCAGGALCVAGAVWKTSPFRKPRTLARMVCVMNVVGRKCARAATC